MAHTTHPPTEPVNEVERAQLAALESDPEYWDYLDELEARLGGAREWDNAVGGAR